jgi:sugar phosphate isomerase/epimerase
VKLGLLTAPFPTTPLLEVADWAGSNGFSALEVCAWPRDEGAARRYSGVSHIDVVDLSADRAQEIVGQLGERGVTISGLGYYPNPLHPDPEHRARVVEHLGRVIAAAPLLGVPVVNTFFGADQHKTQAENLAEGRKQLTELVSQARDAGVKLAIEHCPMIFSTDEWPSGHNAMYSPAAWREVFGWFDDDTIGLNLDPSHLVWQMIDVERVVREFGSRIFHVHLKDLEVDREGLYDHGILSAGIGWQVPRLPGLGEVRWDRFFAALHRAGYTGPVVVEHEDRRFEGSDERVKAGFLLARDVLAPYVH